MTHDSAYGKTDRPTSESHDRDEVPMADGLMLRSTTQLVIAAQTGCDRAFAELFERFRPRLNRFIDKRLAGHTVDAEDVTQDTFARAWQHLANYDSQYKFSTWLYTIAIRIAHDHLKRPRLRSSDQLHIDASEIVGSTASPARECERMEQAANMWDIAKVVLSTDQFSATWLRYGEELSVAEVARVLRKTSVGIRVLLHRSRGILKSHLSDYAPNARETPQPELHVRDNEGREVSL